MDQDEVVHEEAGTDVGAVFAFDPETGAGVGAQCGSVVAVDAQFDRPMSGPTRVIQDMAQHLLSEAASVPGGIEVELVEMESGAVRVG